ncbi:MAG: sulfotransferase [Phycisphaerales bacterium]|nr:sulfotransferase [Phycisphaerales bacterium]
MIRKLKRAREEYGLNPRAWYLNWKWRTNARSSDLPVTFVVGAPRSGTTLIQKVIESHSRYFAHDDETAMFTKQNIFRLNRRHFGLDGRELVDALGRSSDVVDFFEHQINRLQVEQGGDFFVEKTPQHLLHLPFILEKFPNGRVVHVVRDGRDSFLSARNHPGVPQGASVTSFAPYWSGLVELGLAVEDDPRVIRIGYEAFTRDQVAEATRLMRHLDCDFEPDQLDPESRAGDRRASTEVFKRLSEPINTASVDRWRTELTGDELAAFMAAAGPTLERLGYPID